MLRSKFKCALIFAIVLLHNHPVQGQILANGQCSSEVYNNDIERLLKNKKNARQSIVRSENHDYIPIKFHVIGNVIGNNKVIENTIFEALCKLNYDYSKTQTQFYIYGDFNYLNNNVLNNISFPFIPQIAAEILSSLKVAGALNIFVGNNQTSGSSGFYSSDLDIIYIDKDYLGENDIILSHEVGHYFSLVHTFFGWEETVYNINLPTPQIVFRGNSEYVVEYVNRNKNCNISGDFLCDTPADYIINWGSGCHYNGGGVDPEGVKINPDETNIMGYFSFAGCSEYGFSADQKAVMYADFLSRADLLQNRLDKQPILEDSINLQLPFDHIETIYTDVTFKWDSVANATIYIFELSLDTAFSKLELHKILDTFEYTAYFLKNNKQYYWRLVAMNETNQCSRLVSQTRTFFTIDYPTGLDEWNEKLTFSIFPNPIDSEYFYLQSLTQISNAKIKIFDSSGRQLMNIINKNLEEGANRIDLIPQNKLSPGVYFVTVEAEYVKNVMKLIVN